jgi:hypothetical protein
MIRLTADQTPLHTLETLNDAAEVYTGEGKLLGVYVPANLGALRHENGDVKLTITEEELQRRLHSKEKGHTSREVFEHLLTLAKDEPTRVQLRQIIAKKQ